MIERNLFHVLLTFGFKAHEQNLTLEQTLKMAEPLLPKELLPVREHRAPCYDPRFTDADREAIFQSFLDEAHDMSHKDMAQILLEGAELVECIGACVPTDCEVEHMAEMLQHLDNDEETYVNGEFLREHNDGDGHDVMLDFAKRMGLTNEDETKLTDLGKEFVSTYS